ncbi:PH domain-containing protein [Streptomyces sp. STR69]|uniref:PH domain-containing protein n=1 Tax=Streptomyces sp. STR69 TaxID=1796942 RepID=UPI0021C58B8E|nr:PH domain-containing protein [Streptomyces sp. STR69]
MTDVHEVHCRARPRRALWLSVAFAAAGSGASAVWTAYRGPSVLWLVVGGSFAVIGLVSLYLVTARVSADARGLRSWTLLRRWSVPWPEVAELRIRLRRRSGSRGGQIRRVGVLLRDGRRRTLPLPVATGPYELDLFQEQLAALRALHQRHGTGVPESAAVPVVSDRTAGRGWAGAAVLWCAVLLVGAGVAAAFVSDTAADQRAWRAAVPCTTATPAAQRRECLTYTSAVIARTDPNRPKKSSWVYFTDDRPFRRLEVPVEAADGFHAGDKVQLTFWRGEVRAVTGSRYVWHRHVPNAGTLAVMSALAVLAAGYPGALTVQRVRGRRLPDDEVLPSALPFGFALAGTALWLVPLCYLHPTTLLASPTTIGWLTAGTLGSAALLTWAWRETRIRPALPVDGVEPAVELPELDGEVFVSARFLEHTDYNPHGFGTHIALGDGPPAVTPGPGRFAARRIPVERLTVKAVRRARGGDGDTVPGDWHIAELDDGGRPVRLAAAPDDLTRVLHELAAVREVS